jgi:transposase
MANERLSMRNLREILRHKLELGHKHRDIGRALSISAGTVGETVVRAKFLGLDWATICTLDDVELETRMYEPQAGHHSARPPPDLPYIHLELRRAGVTLQVLHVEYLEKNPNGFRYTAFCDLYRKWRKKRAATMRQQHKAGDKTFLDYSGKKPHLVDPVTGEHIPVELYVAALGASSFTFAEATRTQQVEDWLGSNVRALAFFGGVTSALVPDQLKSAVTHACRYEPGIQKTFDEFAEHYGTVIMPARPAKPRDKAKVEVAVQVVQRWILARIRNEVFFTLAELNARIRELLDDLNNRKMRIYGCSRLELFERLDKPALRPLPGKAYEYSEWLKVKLNVDYHVAFEDHYYSAPSTLLREELWLRATVTTIEIFHISKREATHARSHVKFGHTTIAAHMPIAHQKHAEWTPGRILHWAATVGPNTALLAQAILNEKPHPEQGYRSCLGIYRLAKKYGNERVDAACSRAFLAGARSYRHVESILRHGLDRAPALDIGSRGTGLGIAHENIRGPDYYH